MNSNQSNQQILLIATHDVIQSGIEVILNNSGISHNLEVTCSLTDGINKLTDTPYDLVIVDTDGNEDSYSKIINNIKSCRLETKILIFSAEEESIFTYPVIQMGANGFLSKSATRKEIIHAIVQILQHESYISNEVQQQVISNWTNNQQQSNPLKLLSSRESDVLLLLLKGCSTSDISNTLNLQPSTISTYKNRIFKKMEVDNVLDLMAKTRLLQEL